MDLADFENQLFIEARTHRAFSDQKIDDATLRHVYELAKLAPTANNYCPMRLSFVKSKEAKSKLMEVAAEGNRPKISSSPVTVIVAYDVSFFKHIPVLAPHIDVSKVEAQSKEDRDKVARELSWLQAGYVIMAARTVGLDCGPINGFNNLLADDAFYKNTDWRSIMLLNLGYGQHDQLRPRAKRLDFTDACEVI
ncbi:malonic semialdehyde reductase [Alphaproteobacteria bacterium]|jgi:nitroreductase|nr:malonic semialdehyde reductase [Alphaproteobacteria bacterium]MDA9816281.1 malonic semialdehyde reductase [Alphaproteobacteria bacterium]MDC3311152.1 malonic semialdehyde reductase [Alphaproteobacteria bacterium]